MLFSLAGQLAFAPGGLLGEMFLHGFGRRRHRRAHQFFTMVASPLQAQSAIAEGG
jgi:hypothetical protein